jgi:hypothetical protein
MFVLAACAMAIARFGAPAISGYCIMPPLHCHHGGGRSVAFHAEVRFANMPHTNRTMIAPTVAPINPAP